MTGNPTTTATPDDDKNEEDVVVNIGNAPNVTGTTNALTGVVGVIGAGGGGGCGSGFVSVDYNPQSWTTSGSLQVQSSVPEVDELKEQVEELKSKIAELEKAENTRKDVEYFRRNLHNALKVPKNYVPIPKTAVGPDDLLVIHIGVKDVPPSRVEAFMKRAKKDIQSIFEERGLTGRVLWCPAREEHTARFSVIGVENGPAVEKAMKEAVDYAKATRTFTPAKKRYPPPVMG